MYIFVMRILCVQTKWKGLATGMSLEVRISLVAGLLFSKCRLCLSLNTNFLCSRIDVWICSVVADIVILNMTDVFNIENLVNCPFFGNLVLLNVIGLLVFNQI